MCEPNYFKEVCSDYWSDILPDDGDGDIPEELETALNALNKVIESIPPASYSAGKKRTIITF